jgi:hypothetical protein
MNTAESRAIARPPLRFWTDLYLWDRLIALRDLGITVAHRTDFQRLDILSKITDYNVHENHSSNKRKGFSQCVFTQFSSFSE